MNEILEKKNRRKKQLEHDLPVIHQIQEFAKNNEKTSKEIESQLKMKIEDIRDMFDSYHLKSSVTNGIFVITREFHDGVTELEKEYDTISEEITGKSFMEKYGRPIIINAASLIIGFLIGKAF